MPKKKDWGASTRSSARLASRELSEEPEREATATRTVKEEDDLCPGAFPDDEHRVVAQPSTEIADDSSIDESSLPPEPPETDIDTQVAVDAQLLASTEEMANEEAPSWFQPMLDRLTALERSSTRAASTTSPSSEGRGTRETSAVGGTGSKSTGLAASKKLDPYGDSQDAKNPDFDPKARETRHLPEVFEGNKEEFEGWMVVIIDYLHTNRYTFRDEGTRMTFVFSRLKSSPRDMVMSRYTSEEDPYASVREMLAHLEVTYGDPHGSTTAYRTLNRLRFDIKKDDINDFISRVNTLADKADVRKTGRKAMLFNCMPQGFDTMGQLQLHSDDSEVSYERFTRFLTAAVLAKKEAYEYQQQRNVAKSSSPPRHRSGRSERSKTRPAPVFDVKKLIDMTREEARNKGACYGCGMTGHLKAECPNKRAVIREFTARFNDEDERDRGYHSQDLSEASPDCESGNDSDH